MKLKAEQKNSLRYDLFTIFFLLICIIYRFITKVINFIFHSILLKALLRIHTFFSYFFEQIHSDFVKNKIKIGKFFDVCMIRIQFKITATNKNYRK